MSHQTNIIDKVYRKLILEIGVDGFGFAVQDTLLNRIESVKTITFDQYSKSESIENWYWKAFLENRELTRAYDNVLVLHNNSWNTLVPEPLFDVAFLSSYLQFSSKVFETDSFAYDVLKNFEMNNVFVPFTNLNNYMLDQFDVFDFRHSSSVLVEKLLEASKNKLEKQVYVHFRKNSFEIVVAENQKLLLFNSFEIANAPDFIYYLLFTVEQIGLDPERFELYFLGDVSQESDFFEVAYKYVRNVSMLDVSEFQKRNNFDVSQNLKNFILLQS